MDNQLLIFGLVLVGLFIMLASWRILHKNENAPGLFEILLILVGALLSIVAIAVENTTSIVFDISEVATLAAGVALLTTGIWGMWVRSNPLQSRGFLAFGAGIVLGAVALALPVYMRQNISEATINLTALSSPQSQSITVLASDTSQSSREVASFSTPIPADVPMDIPTLDAPIIIFETPTPTPEYNENCEAVVTTRLNMRHLPSTAAGNVLQVVPEDTTVTLLAHDDSNEWWFTIIDREEGWLSGEFLAFGDGCERLPIRNWS